MSDASERSIAFKVQRRQKKSEAYLDLRSSMQSSMPSFLGSVLKQRKEGREGTSASSQFKSAEKGPMLLPPSASYTSDQSARC